MTNETRVVRRPGQRLPYVWDYDIDEAGFPALLEGRETLGRLDRSWAAVRLLEHAPRAGDQATLEPWRPGPEMA